jgi:hypothetical protein
MVQLPSDRYTSIICPSAFIHAHYHCMVCLDMLQACWTGWTA